MRSNISIFFQPENLMIRTKSYFDVQKNVFNLINDYRFELSLINLYQNTERDASLL